MLSKDNIINLEDFRVRDTKTGAISKVFTGRDRGEFVREKSKVDKIESNYSSVTIIIPNNVYSINPSFFEELFVNVVKKLGKDNFLKKFNFISQGNYDYTKQLNEAIDRILRPKTRIEMNILDLPLKAIWYNMIESGEKKEEYREHNSYWAKRFYDCYDKNTDCKIYIPEKCKYCCKPPLKHYDAVRFRYGYTKRTMLFKLNSISIGKGHSEWGAPDNEVFILKLGNRIN